MVGLRFLLIVATLAAIFTAAPGRAGAQEEYEKGTFGIGLIVGEPSGVSAKLYLGSDSNLAIDGAVGSAVVGGGIQVHADILWHPWILTTEDTFVLPAYVGVGVRALNADRGRTESDFHTGMRLVAGMVFDFKTIPLDVFVEVAGVGDYVFSDDTKQKGFGLDLNAGAGVRYYF